MLCHVLPSALWPLTVSISLSFSSISLIYTSFPTYPFAASIFIHLLQFLSYPVFLISFHILYIIESTKPFLQPRISLSHISVMSCSQHVLILLILSPPKSYSKSHVVISLSKTSITYKLWLRISFWRMQKHWLVPCQINKVLLVIQKVDAVIIYVYELESQTLAVIYIWKLDCYCNAGRH